ncbi:unnamed protein product [Parnassius mnemosyne]|uniref:DNA helicase Pif1-like 2B domain-containing protein n=1 Tax=Parnassius mnemosyne TaxID=213953 RepID=A0AAV1K821_9NEOP
MRVMLQNDQCGDIFSKQLIDIDDIPGEMRTYKSIDTATNEDNVVNYPAEFLNSLDLPGLPPHNLQVGSVVIMLQNINQPQLCNGTRLPIKNY